MDNVPEIEASLPEPDLDAIVNKQDLLPTQLLESSPVSQQLIPESILELGRAELKYDDKLCGLNEFTIEFEPWDDKNSDDRITALEASFIEQGSESEGGDEEQDKLTDTKVLAQKSTAPAAKDNGVISSSEADTSESRAGSTVIRLCLPSMPKIQCSIKNKYPVKKTRPSSSVKGEPGSRNISSSNRESRSKRKLSEKEDLEYEPDDEDEENAEFNENRFKTTTKSRPTHKTARYGDEDDEVDDESYEAGKIRSRRTARELSRHGFETGDEEEQLESENYTDEQDEVNSVPSEISSEPVSQKRRSTKYWIDNEGVLFFEDGNGIIHKFNHQLKILLTRLTDEDIDNIRQEATTQDQDDTQYNPFLLEVCVDNFMSVVEAVKGGAKRIVLCSSLFEGGLTPSVGFLTLVKETFPDLPIFTMIRPRGGDFVYSPDEIEVMNRDISFYKQMGADGFLFGPLTKDCQIDRENCKLLKQMAFPLECTFHRAFDMVSNPFSALEAIIGMGFTRILTSGQAATAYDGIPMLRKLVHVAGSRITIVAGAGLNQWNVGEIVRKSGVKEVHGSASKFVASKMCAPGPSKPPKLSTNKISVVKIGSTDDSVLKVTDSKLVAKIVRNGKK